MAAQLLLGKKRHFCTFDCRLNKALKLACHATNLVHANTIPYVAIVGDSEMEANKVMLKNMTTGEQQQVTIDELIKLLV